MIDFYADDMTLEKIEVKQNKQILIFRNKEKDETVALNVSDSELLNIALKTQMRCETLNLISATKLITIRKDGDK